MFDKQFITELAKALAPQLALLLPKPQSGIAPRYLNLNQAAEYLSTSPAAVRRMLRDKHFPCRKIGARTFIDKQDIDAVMDANRSYLN